jgi:exodeoxyribonuclease V alpha subunit
VLASSRDEGHCYLTKEQITKNAKLLLELEDDEIIHNCILALLNNKDIKLRTLTIDDEITDCYYSKSLYYDEQHVSQKVKLLVNQNPHYDISRIQNWIHRYCQLRQINLSDEQRTSVEGIAQKSFSILTGGPGCGKTTTLKVLVRLLLAMEKKVLLAAPTGRAAQRMSEVIGIEAKTIHRLLEWEPGSGGFKKNEESPLNCDFLIVDECSMLDITLASSLLRAVPSKSQVLFIGDPDQLPSVGAGSVLADLLSCNNVTNFKLTQIFRQAAKSRIIKFAHDINRGKVPQISSPINEPDIWNKSVDCLFIDSEEATQEQLRFIAKAKSAINKTLSDGSSYLLKTDSKITGQMDKIEEQISVQNLYIPEPDNLESINEPILTIPKKFRHVDLEKLSLTSSTIDELRNILKDIHPWSSLHYGLTALETIKRLYTKTINEKFRENYEIQVLTPQIRGSLGTHNLNSVLQESVNPNRDKKIQIKLGERFFREGDRIIQTRNNYDLNVFNGDIGIIEHIDSSDYSCSIRFYDQNRTVLYRIDDLSEISLAYAITIHKSQGSEFDAVIIPISKQHFKMLYRNLIYTGLTRAKKLAILIGSRGALALAVKNIDNKKRQTALQFLVSE